MKQLGTRARLPHGRRGTVERGCDAGGMWQAVRATASRDGSSGVEDDQIVIATELHVLQVEEPKVARLILHTLEGNAAFGITDEVAGHLIDMLQRFLVLKPE